MNEFEDRTAVITGAGRGIGRGIALRCASEGMNVVLAGIRTEPLVQTAADLGALGAETLIVQTDVSEETDVERLAAKSYERFGAAHLLVNNAGVGVNGSLWERSINDWHWVMGVNFYGVLYAVRAFIPRMIAQDSAAHIVNISSIAGLTPAGGIYGVSKHAVVALSEALYWDLADQAPQISLSVYCPGWVNTELDRIDSTERPRPQRFSRDSTRALSAEQQAEIREMFDQGFTIEESADALFEGLRNDRFYIGLKAFQQQIVDQYDIGLDEMILKRAENIVNERSPAPRASRRSPTQTSDSRTGT